MTIDHKEFIERHHKTARARHQVEGRRHLSSLLAVSYTHLTLPTSDLV